MSVLDGVGDMRREVEDDVTVAFSTAFPGEFSIAEPFDALPAIFTADVSVVPWVWKGVHEGAFLDARATGNAVEITGVTLVTQAGPEPVFHRIVDWQALYRQIGFAMVCRRPRSPDTERFDTIDIPDTLS